MRRRWASTVTAGPDATAPARAAEGAEAAPRERDALPAWSAESTRRFPDALREAGPDRARWRWWGDSQSPQTSWAVARHQVQEAAVHTCGAQNALGTPLRLPEEVALDGVDEFLSTSCATTSTWPRKPAALEFRAMEGRSRRLPPAATA
ncbi:maleylpyruvate isomerase N-terminal domain-containing protein [Streptomyces sp. KHY 26]|uniref:maleylpyruvate isomerase N-terminal domain-containing protein n=1 Tax=Streptomyces sp. KHY 26 TaxID=3097359 RepID=UPI00376EDB0C